MTHGISLTQGACRISLSNLWDYKIFWSVSYLTGGWLGIKSGIISMRTTYLMVISGQFVVWSVVMNGVVALKKGKLKWLQEKWIDLTSCKNLRIKDQVLLLHQEMIQEQKAYKERTECGTWAICNNTLRDAYIIFILWTGKTILYQI